MIPSRPQLHAQPVIVPPWMPVAFGEVGVLEDTRPGKSAARISEYHSVTRAGVSTDDVPWCASFVSWCLECAGVPSTRSKTAASYGSWGEPCFNPVFGCVVLFGRGDRDAVGSGHVAFNVGVSGMEIYVLGGNQNNRVSIRTRRLDHVLAYRMPPIANRVA